MTAAVSSTRRDWEVIAREFQDHRKESIARVSPAIPEAPSGLPLDVVALPRQLLSRDEVDITETSPEELVANLISGRLTSTTVTNAFLRRAGLAQKLVNCITELLPERALERARFLDDYLAKHKAPIGPLHGLPISVKEHIAMKGLTLNGGFICFHDHVAAEDAHILRILWDAGAVFYARTTQPQTLMHLETSSNYYGTTVNPFNRNLTSGGSSGGEGALIGIRGSCLGIGTDIGGSIRSPAANNGLYGLRPTSFRVPLEGMFASMAGQDHIIPVKGPLSTSLDGVKLFMQTILGAKPWLTEPSLMPIPWDTEATLHPPEKPLKIAIMWSDGVVNPHPPVTRALGEVRDKLQNVPNIEIVDWNPYRHEEAWSIIASLYFVDGGDEDKAALEASGEPWMPLSKHILQNEFVKRLSIEELWEWQAKREKYKAEYAQLWNNTGKNRVGGSEEKEGSVDAILCPTGPGAAPLLETSKWWGYTSQWNLLDYPAVTFPVTRVDPTRDMKEVPYQPLNAKDKFNYDLYEPEKFKGAPVSLQMVGRRYQDEKVIGIVDHVKKSIGLPFAKFV